MALIYDERVPELPFKVIAMTAKHVAFPRYRIRTLGLILLVIIVLCVASQYLVYRISHDPFCGLVQDIREYPIELRELLKDLATRSAQAEYLEGHCVRHGFDASYFLMLKSSLNVHDALRHRWDLTPIAQDDYRMVQFWMDIPAEYSQQFSDQTLFWGYQGGERGDGVMVVVADSSQIGRCLVYYCFEF